MTWNFRVAYGTKLGESLWLQITTRQGENPVAQELPMTWLDSGHWQLEVVQDFPVDAVLEYNYVLREGGVSLREWGGARRWRQGAVTVTVESVLFLDDWRSAGAVDRIYEAKVFQAIEKTERMLESSTTAGNHEFNLHMARPPEGMIPCILGSTDGLGEWDYEKALPMAEVRENTWQVQVDLPLDWQVEYKYGIYSKKDSRAIQLENGEGNRQLNSPRNGADAVRISDEEYRRGADQKFRGAGVAIPVFSLKSERGCGVGEFLDLKEMGDWAASAGLKMLQILPINDTTSTRTWTDSYPYSAISVFALHPIYLRVDELSYPLRRDAEFRREQRELNKLKELDYEAVMSVKWRVTRGIFKENYSEIIKDEEFLAFLKKNGDWVLDYGVFSVKRDQFGTADFAKWGPWAEYDSKMAEALAASMDVLYYVWLQYELDRQLKDAVSHLRSIGIALKGDLPIGVDRESVDAWTAPHLFNMDAQTGAPPDAFTKKGQNWGFPTYNWQEMKKDGYSWWRSRFEKLSHYFDVYRIDHILGFFRIWQIPQEHIDGIMGSFDPALPVKLQEFAERGISFDHSRFCKPFITEDVLEQTFGELASGVRQDFLNDLGLGRYEFKQAFSTQRKIENFFEKLTPGDWANQQWIKDALLAMVTDVLFFEVEGSAGKEFHPRMSMAETNSFQQLEEEVRRQLMAIHDDYFYVRQEAFWRAQALEKLPALRAASDMLLCGEDLGMVPDCVPGVMASMGMLSLEIQRWPKGGHAEFFHPKYAPYMSVVATGTHDMETLRAWWRADEQLRARFASGMFGIGSPPEDLSGEIAEKIIAQHLHSPAMWAIFPFQDLLAIDENIRSQDIYSERINDPAVSPFYWRWRMEMDIRQLAENESFKDKLLDLISTAGR